MAAAIPELITVLRAAKNEYERAEALRVVLVWAKEQGGLKEQTAEYRPGYWHTCNAYVDAAMALVPDGFGLGTFTWPGGRGRAWCVAKEPSGDGAPWHDAATLPIAIAIAALAARLPAPSKEAAA